MTKRELIEAVAARAGLPAKKDAEFAVNSVFELMTEALARGERIELRGFGSFQIRHRKAREGRNPLTGRPVAIPPRRALAFRAGKDLMRMVCEGPVRQRGEDG